MMLSCCQSTAVTTTDRPSGVALVGQGTSDSMENTNVTRADDWMLVTRIVSDTRRLGFDIPPPVPSAPRTADDFSSGDSVIGIYGFKSLETRTRNWFWNLYQVDWPTVGETRTYEKEAVMAYGECFAMAELLDEQAINKTVGTMAEQFRKRLTIEVVIK